MAHGAGCPIGMRALPLPISIREASTPLADSPRRCTGTADSWRWRCVCWPTPNRCSRRWCWRLGVEPQGTEADARLVALCEKEMREGQMLPDAFFFAHRGGLGAD